MCIQGFCVRELDYVVLYATDEGLIDKPTALW